MPTKSDTIFAHLNSFVYFVPTDIVVRFDANFLVIAVIKLESKPPDNKSAGSSVEPTEYLIEFSRILFNMFVKRSGI